MGQRSQIYVRVDGNLAVANYYQWNYGDQMISRARYGIEWIKKRIRGPFASAYAIQREWCGFENFRRIWDVNFDYKNIITSTDIFTGNDVGKWDGTTTLEDFIFNGVDNDSGKLFVDVDTELREVRFTLTDCDGKIQTPDEYADEQMEGWRKPDYKYLEPELKEACLNNIAWLKENAIQMTEIELKEFIEFPFDLPF